MQSFLWKDPLKPGNYSKGFSRVKKTENGYLKCFPPSSESSPLENSSFRTQLCWSVLLNDLCLLRRYDSEQTSSCLQEFSSNEKTIGKLLYCVLINNYDSTGTQRRDA